MLVRTMLFLAFGILASSSFAAVEVRVISGSGKTPDARFAGLQPAASSTDLLEGLRPVVEGAGTFPDFSNTGVLTDGKVNGTGGSAQVVFMDSPGAKDVGCSTTLTYTLPAKKDIGIIRVYSSNGDVRAYQCYDVDVRTDMSDTFTTVAKEVRAGQIGNKFYGNDTNQLSMISEVRNPSYDPLARNVIQIRFTFWAVGNSFQGNMVTSRDAAINQQAIMEIDVLPPPPSNVDADAPLQEPGVEP